MNFSDIDFSAISRMLDSMSDEQKEKLTNMAAKMADNLKEETQEQEELSVYEKLSIDEDDYSFLNGSSLDQIEAALDLEEYYEDFPEADLSASILFYQKALLNTLRKYTAPVFDQAGLSAEFSRPDTCTLYSFIQPLYDEQKRNLLISQGYGSEEFISWMASRLMQVYSLLNQAEYSKAGRAENERMKEILFSERLLVNVCQWN